jgi:hypothetical protein
MVKHAQRYFCLFAYKSAKNGSLYPYMINFTHLYIIKTAILNPEHMTQQILTSFQQKSL